MFNFGKKAGITGVSEKTPDQILYGAGTIHKNLKYTENWNFDESIIGATNGGFKVSIVPEINGVQVDGAVEDVMEFTKKTGEKANVEVNFAEMSPDVMKASTLGKEGSSKDASLKVIESKTQIEPGDFWENIAYVGKTLSGQPIIVILDNALCKTGFEPEPKAKEGSVFKATFTCHASVKTGADKLPWHIYYPSESLPASTMSADAKGTEGQTKKA